MAALALAALALALARPHATVAVPVERASVVLVTDASRSMLATDVEPSRMDAARSAAGAFLDGVPDELRVGAVGFSTTPSSVVPPTQDRERVRAHLASLQADGSTATGDALAEALQLLGKTGQDGGRPRQSCCCPTARRPRGATPSMWLARRVPQAFRSTRSRSAPSGGTITDSSGNMPPVPPDPETMAEIARTSGGESFDVDDGDQLDAVYERLGSQIGTRPEKREITAGFAAGGMALLLAAAGLSLRAGGRLP